MHNTLIIGAGGVAQVAAHKCAQNNDILGNICVASRTRSKCQEIIESVVSHKSIKDNSKLFSSTSVDALDTAAVIKVIEETESTIVLNLASPFVNMSVLDACIEAGVTYIDTAIYEHPDRVAAICEPPPWYGNYEWKKKEACKQAGVTAILGIGFDPGVVNAYCAMAARNYFDAIDTIDIMDVNAGSHGKYFSTNFDPEINFREFTGKVLSWIDRKWVQNKVHEVKQVYDFPEVGKQTIYLTGHDEVHSLSQNIDANSIRFWMGFGDHYINCFNVLKNIGLLSEKPVMTAEGLEVIPLKVVKACLPDPKTLAPNYVGKTCIGCLVKGTRLGNHREIFTYNICDHVECYRETDSQAISYTAGVPAVAAAILVANGEWNPKTMVNVEELPPVPFINLLDKMGLPTKTEILVG